MRRYLVLLSLIVAAAIGLSLAQRFGSSPPEAGIIPALARASGDVVARGRIEPSGGVIVVSGPPESASTVALVDKLLVQQGSKVEAGQILAVLYGYDLSQADLKISTENLRLARLQRKQLDSGTGKTAEIAAQANVLAARRAQLVKAEKDLDRATALVQSKSASPQLLDTQKAAFDQATQEVQQSENAIKAMTEVRPVDDEVAAEQVAVAEANVDRARAAVARLEVRARSAGTVLSIQTHAGEAIGSDGILRLGDLDHLIVVAEVSESGVGRIEPGMAAKIEGPVLATTVAGTVSRIGLETRRQRRPSSDILVGRDARIVEVEVVPALPIPDVVGAEVTVRFTAAAGTS